MFGLNENAAWGLFFVVVFTPFNPFAEVQVHRLKLPHWQQKGTTYFVTARLADSLPAAQISVWKARRDAWLKAKGIGSVGELSLLTEEEIQTYHKNFTAKFHELLDAGHGEAVLADSRCADVLRSRFAADHETAYRLDAWCIMPNHWHVLVQPADEIELGEIVRKWKGGSAFEINRLLGRQGKLWQTEAFDHIVRSEAQLNRFRRYIAENPKTAGLKRGFLLGVGARAGLDESDFARLMLEAEQK